MVNKPTCRKGHSGKWYVQPSNGGRRCKTCFNDLGRRTWADRRDKPGATEARARARKIRMDKKRELVYDHYGRSCACCGEFRKQFLTIDHIARDGSHHRKTFHGLICDWLVRNGYPDGFQILCFNCNCGRERNNGTCPHLEEYNQRGVCGIEPDTARTEANLARIDA